MLIEQKCHICDSDSYTVVHEDKNSQASEASPESYKITDHGVDAVRVIRCHKCGLSFQSPRPVPENIINNYEAMVDDKYLEEEQGRRASARNILKYLNREVKGKGAILDIGCATGFLLDEAKKDGWNVHGVETSHWAAQYAKDNFDLKNI